MYDAKDYHHEDLGQNQWRNISYDGMYSSTS